MLDCPGHEHLDHPAPLIPRFGRGLGKLRHVGVKVLFGQVAHVMAGERLGKFAQPIPGIPPVILAQLRSTALAGKGFALAKGDKLVYRFMHRNAFDRYN
ncbi:MAG: hypothetical protein ABSD29_14810 [Verrucomicrobiota bacterium]